MNKPTIKFCEDKKDNLLTFNVFSNLFIILGGIYGLLQLKFNRINQENLKLFYLTEIGIITVGLGSMYFHYKNDYFSQLFDELPMSIALLFYMFLVNKKTYINFNIIIFTLIGWILYLGNKKFIIFEIVFTIQILFLIFFLLKNYKSYYQLKLIISAITVLGTSKLLWNYEQYLFKINQCPYDKYSFKYYLHSYWHLGISISHVILMHRLR